MTLASLLAPPWVKPAAIALALAGAGTLGWQGHNRMVYQPHLKKDIQRALNMEVKLRAIEANANIISGVARDRLDTQQTRVRTVTQTLVKAIPLYVDASTPALVCPPGVDTRGPVAASLPLGFVRLHDYAALGIDPPLPAPSGEPLAGPSGVKLPDLTATLVRNYGVSHEYYAEVMAWRAWYKAQAGAWDKAAAKGNVKHP